MEWNAIHFNDIPENALLSNASPSLIDFEKYREVNQHPSIVKSPQFIMKFQIPQRKTISMGKSRIIKIKGNCFTRNFDRKLANR